LIIPSTSAVCHSRNVGSVLDILVEVAYRTSNFMPWLNGHWYYGYEAESKPLPSLENSRLVVSAVLTLDDYSLVSLESRRESMRSTGEQEEHGGEL